jgi:hypothetical protein
MKKLFFFLLSSFSFCFLHAQEKTSPFDPEKYIEKKKANANQIYDWSFKKKVTDGQYKKLMSPSFSITIDGTAYILPNGNKVITLLQDNMPCMVPDMKQFNMPVLKPEVPATMPNAIGLSQRSRAEIISDVLSKQKRK